jgi:hypothetical protein
MLARVVAMLAGRLGGGVLVISPLGRRYFGEGSGEGGGISETE